VEPETLDPGLGESIGHSFALNIAMPGEAVTVRPGGVTMTMMNARHSFGRHVREIRLKQTSGDNRDLTF